MLSKLGYMWRAVVCAWLKCWNSVSRRQSSGKRWSFVDWRIWWRWWRCSWWRLEQLGLTDTPRGTMATGVRRWRMSGAVTVSAATWCQAHHFQVCGWALPVTARFGSGVYKGEDTGRCPPPSGTDYIRHGGTCPHLYKWLCTGEPWVEEQQTKNWPNFAYTFRTKNVEEHDQKIVSGALRRTGAPPPHYQIRSCATLSPVCRDAKFFLKKLSQMGRTMSCQFTPRNFVCWLFTRCQISRKKGTRKNSISATLRSRPHWGEFIYSAHSDPLAGFKEPEGLCIGEREVRKREVEVETRGSGLLPFLKSYI